MKGSADVARRFGENLRRVRRGTTTCRWPPTT